MAGLRLLAERHFRDDRSLFTDALIERLIFRRIDDVDAAGDDGAGAARKRGFVGGRIDAARKTRRDHEACSAQIVRKLPRQLSPERRGIARSHDRHHFARQLRDASQAPR